VFTVHYWQEKKLADQIITQIRGLILHSTTQQIS